MTRVWGGVQVPRRLLLDRQFAGRLLKVADGGRRDTDAEVVHDELTQLLVRLGEVV